MDIDLLAARAHSPLEQMANIERLAARAAEVVSDVGTGFGLVNMRERVAFLGGRLAISSSRESGTRIVATVPCPAVAVD
jgi:signal transduction histidine kinase